MMVRYAGGQSAAARDQCMVRPPVGLSVAPVR